MSNERDDAMDVFCMALEMKEKKRALYEDAMRTCPDQVGIETFRMLRDAEEDHAGRIREIYNEIRGGGDWSAACRFREISIEDKQAALGKLADEKSRIPKACLDDVAAIEVGLQLENASIELFRNRLEKTIEGAEREFLRRIVAEDTEHYILLADLKFYYLDPAAWFMEKSRARLDGAGGGT